MANIIHEYCNTCNRLTSHERLGKKKECDICGAKTNIGKPARDWMG